MRKADNPKKRREDSARPSSLLTETRKNWRKGNWTALTSLKDCPPVKSNLSPDQLELILYKAQSHLIVGNVDKYKSIVESLRDNGISASDIVKAQSASVSQSIETSPDKDTALAKGNKFRYSAAEFVSLDKNPAHVFASKHALCHFASGAIYSFIPKNGCTNLRYSLAVDGGLISGPNDFDWIHSNIGTFIANLRELVTTPYRFVILRCPFARLASVYLDKIVHQKDVINDLSAINTSSIENENLSFRDFVTLLMNDDSILKNHHWRPQKDFLVYQDYDDWFRLEKYADAIDKIEQKTKMRVIDTRQASKHGTERYEKLGGDFSDTPASEIYRIHMKGYSPSHRAMYDPRLLDIVENLYTSDMNIYKSQFGEFSLLESSPVLSTKGSE